MIPPRVIGSGDIDVASTYVGFAKSELRKLQHRMSLVRPKPLTSAANVISPTPGIAVAVWSSFIHSGVFVHAGEGAVEKVKKKLLREVEQECPCFPHFSIGRITAVDPPVPEAGGDTDAYLEFLLDGRFEYEVEICAGNSYIKALEVLDANYGRYNVSQLVMVTLGESMSAWDDPIDCSRNCLLQAPRFDVLAISPIHNLSGMRKWYAEDEYVL